jgi:hypothetical protein
VKPTVDQVLATLAGRLFTEIAPRIPDDYVKSNAEMTGMLMVVAAEAFDRAAEVRVDENAAIRGIFRDAARVVPGQLRERLAAAAVETDPGLRVSVLDAANARLRKLLIELHALVEEETADWARPIERAIWGELRASAARRAIAFYPL